MRILLINPPSVHRDFSEVAPPLGLYALAAVAKTLGIETRVWDANIEAQHRGDARFYADAAAIIAEYNPALIGLTSMVVNSHIALEVMRVAKEASPSLITVAGGPHFSSCAAEVIKAFPWVDYIVRGEGEAAFALLLENYADGTLPRVVAAPVPQDLLDRVRPPFEDVPWGKYFNRNSRRTVDYESSRGCVFQCTFCYSPGQWGRMPRYVSDDVVISDLRALEGYGVEHIFFVDDNFVNDVERADRLCVRLARERINVRWLCYATINRLDKRIINRLAAGGCESVFVGIDAVTSDSQRQFRKRFFRARDEIVGRLRRCVESGITPTCALIVRPDAGDAELDELLECAADLREVGCAVRLNPLIGYQATPFAPNAQSAWYTEARVRLMLDDSSLLRENRFAQAMPYLFPYHCSTREPLANEIHLRDVHAAGTVIRHFPKTVTAMRKQNERVWSRIQKIARSARACRRANLRESERKMAIRTFRQELSSSDAKVAAREFATSALLKSEDWIPIVLRSNHRDRVAHVRPFAMDETGVAPDLLVAAFDQTVRTFELDANVDRDELRAIVALFKTKRPSQSPLHINKQTVSVLRSADLLRFPRLQT